MRDAPGTMTDVCQVFQNKPGPTRIVSLMEKHTQQRLRRSSQPSNRGKIRKPVKWRSRPGDHALQGDQPAVHAIADRQRESGGWSRGLGRDFAARRMQPFAPFFAPIGCVATYRCCMGSPMTTTGEIIAPSIRPACCAAEIAGTLSSSLRNLRLTSGQSFFIRCPPHETF